MKSVLLLSICFFQSLTFASHRTLICRNEAHSPVTALISLNDANMILKFGSGSSGSSLEDGVRNKTVKLSVDPDSSSNGWIAYEGEVLTDPTFSDYRTIQVRYESQNLKSKPEFRVVFFISDVHAQYSSSGSSWSYGMRCK